eukprot:gene9673-1879_t
MQEPTKSFSISMYQTLGNIVQEYEKSIEELLKNQTEVGKKIDHLNSEIKELEKVCDEFKIKKATETLTESKRKLLLTHTTLGQISVRLHGLIQAAALKYPELEEVNKYKNKKLEQKNSTSSIETGEKKSESTTTTPTPTSTTTNDVLETNTQESPKISVDATILKNFQPKIIRPENNEYESLLTDEDTFNIHGALPNICKLKNFELLFDTRQDGISLITFFEKAKDHHETILVIKTDEGEVFGGFAPETWKLQQKYYGDGQCFLFELKPEFKKYSWSKKNTFFQFSKNECLAFGGGGNFGLWIDNEFSFGSSHRCKTFDNEQLSKEDEDFMIYAVELYAFTTEEKSTVEEVNIKEHEKKQTEAIEKKESIDVNE